MLHTGRLPSIQYIFLLLLILVIASCSKKQNITIIEQSRMNPEEAFAWLEGALSVPAKGLFNEVLEAIGIYESLLLEMDPNPHCDLAERQSDSDIFDNKRFQGTIKLNRQWLLNCRQAGIPEALVYSWEGDLSYDSRQLAVKDYTDGTLTLIRPAGADHWRCSGTYERTGRQSSGIQSNKIFESSLLVTFTEVGINRSTRQARSGSAAFAISGAVLGGRAFYLNGHIEFLDNAQAKITIGDDHTFIYPF